MSVREAVVAVLACAGMAAGCTEQHVAPPPTPESVAPTAIPRYDASLPPAQAVLALVPLAATTLRLVDLTEIRRQVGLPELTSMSPASDRAAYRARAAVDAPLLDPSVLAPADDRLRASYGFGEDDVAWEAHFSGHGRRGWVLAFAADVDMRAVARGPSPDHAAAGCPRRRPRPPRHPGRGCARRAGLGERPCLGPAGTEPGGGLRRTSRLSGRA